MVHNQHLEKQMKLGDIKEFKVSKKELRGSKVSNDSDHPECDGSAGAAEVYSPFYYRTITRRASAFSQGFFPLRSNKGLIMLLWLTIGHFRCSVLTLITFSSNRENLEN